MAPKKTNTQTAAPAPAQQPPAAQTPTPAYQPTETDIALMRAIDSGNQSGNVRFVSSAEAAHLVAKGLVTVDITKLDPATGNAAAALSETGKAHVMTPNDTAPVGTNAPATGAPAPAAAAADPAPVSFAIARVDPPSIKRTPPKGGGQKPKYPQLDALEEGEAMFIPAPANADTKKLSKTFGSMMADRNSRDKTKYFTSRGIPDGKEAGFVGVNEDGTPNPEAYAGVAGTGLYRRPLSERKTRAPRKPKDGAAAAQTPEQLAAANAAAANAGTAGIVGAPGTDAAGVAPATV